MVCNSAALAKYASCEIADLKALPDDHPVWDLAAHYLACLCANLILTVSPERIVLSGGVLLRLCLFPKIRAKTQEYLNGYIDVPQVTTAEVRPSERAMEYLRFCCYCCCCFKAFSFHFTSPLFISSTSYLTLSLFSLSNRTLNCIAGARVHGTECIQGIANLIVPSKHGNAAGMVGALFLGSKALEDSKKTAASANEGGGPLSTLQPYSTFLVGLASGLALAGVALKLRN